MGSKKSFDNGGDHSADYTETGPKEDEIDIIIGKRVHEQNTATDATTIQEVTSWLLAGVAEKVIEKVHELSGTEMRKLLLVYMLGPFQTDGLVNAMEEEMNRRTAALGFSGGTERIQDLAKHAADIPPFRPVTVKNGIKTIFGVHDIGNEFSEEDAAR
jgi:hypothetical protein